MKLSHLITALAAALPALADFDVYSLLISREGIYRDAGYQMYDEAPDCHSLKGWYWKDFRDVSSRPGLRCKGACGNKNDPAGIQELELNFDNYYHWTVYEDREWALVDEDDEQVGTCMPFAGHSFVCQNGAYMVETSRKLHCVVDGITADDVNARAPQNVGTTMRHH